MVCKMPGRGFGTHGEVGKGQPSMACEGGSELLFVVVAKEGTSGDIRGRQTIITAASL